MSFIGEDFRNFVQSTSRRDFIIEWLGSRGVKAVVMPIDGHEHIYVVFSRESYSPFFKIKTVIAHYDIFPGSPGANDNSSSVFSLMNWAVKLNQSGTVHNVRLIFTDGEEMCEKPFQIRNSVSAQGAFGLAGVFKRLSITDDDVFVFDCTGRGNLPVLCKTVLPAKVSQKFRNRFNDLKYRIEQVLKKSSDGRFVNLPVSYSDNAGFLVNGIAAVQVTFLPQDEAEKYMYSLMNFPFLEEFVMNKKVPSGFNRSALEEMIPQTWKKLHTPEDNVISLDEESFVLMEKILDGIAMLKAAGS